MLNRPFQMDRHHVYLHILDLNMRLFERYYCQSGITDERLLRPWQRARRMDQRFWQTDVEAAEAINNQEIELRKKGAPGVPRRKAAKRAKSTKPSNATGGKGCRNLGTGEIAGWGYNNHAAYPADQVPGRYSAGCDCGVSIGRQNDKWWSYRSSRSAD